MSIHVPIQTGNIDVLYEDNGDGTLAETVYVTTPGEEFDVVDIVIPKGTGPYRVNQRYKDMEDGTFARVIYLSDGGEYDPGEGDVVLPLVVGGNVVPVLYKGLGDGTHAEVVNAPNGGAAVQPPSYPYALQLGREVILLDNEFISLV